MIKNLFTDSLPVVFPSLVNKFISFFICAIVCTMPLLFGAVHPIVLGSYVFLLLICCGGYLLYNCKIDCPRVPSLWLAVPLYVILFILFQSIPLPLDWIELLSPIRAERLQAINDLAFTDLKYGTISDSGVFGLYQASFYFALILYYFTLKSLLDASDKFLSIFVICLVIVGGLEALYGLFQFIKPDIGILWLRLVGRAAHGTIIYKNQYASLLNMIWPLAIASGSLYFLQKKSQDNNESKNATIVASITSIKIEVVLYFFATFFMILAVLFSLSRGGILAMVFISIMMLFLLPYRKKTKVIFLIVFFVLLSAYCSLLGIDSIISRFSALDKSGAHRFDIYLSSLPMIFDHWPTGIGVGSYKLLSPVYLKDFPANILYDKAHNEYIELFVEFGAVVGLFIIGWIVSGIVQLKIMLTRAIHNRDLDPNLLVLGIASFCGLLSLLLHGLVDFGWRLPANSLYGVTLLALCTSCISGVSSSSTKE